jgi:hypothetical protein
LKSIFWNKVGVIPVEQRHALALPSTVDLAMLLKNNSFSATVA